MGCRTNVTYGFRGPGTERLDYSLLVLRLNWKTEVGRAAMAVLMVVDNLVHWMRVTLARKY